METFEPEDLDDRQRARVTALRAARTVLGSTGLLSSSLSASVYDLVVAANYILTGSAGFDDDPGPEPDPDAGVQVDDRDDEDDPPEDDDDLEVREDALRYGP